MRRPNSWFKPGELARLVLDVLRTAPAALSVREITGQIMERRGLDPQDARTAELLRKLVSNTLNRQAADLVERIQDGVLVGWRVREYQAAAAALPVAAEVDRRAAVGDQHDDDAELHAVAVTPMVLLPGGLHLPGEEPLKVPGCSIHHHGSAMRLY